MFAWLSNLRVRLRTEREVEENERGYKFAKDLVERCKDHDRSAMIAQLDRMAYGQKDPFDKGIVRYSREYYQR